MSHQFVPINPNRYVNLDHVTEITEYESNGSKCVRLHTNKLIYSGHGIKRYNEIDICDSRPNSTFNVQQFLAMIEKNK